MKLNLHITFNFFDLKINVVSVVTLTILFSLFFVRTGNAASFQLSGRVTDNTNNPIADADIDVLDTDTRVVISHTQSDASGFYSIIVGSGTYTIKVTEDKESKLSPIILTQTVSKDTSLNIIFVSTLPDAKNYLYNIVTNPLYK